MKIKNLIAGMLTVVMLAGPGTMTCYAAGSSEADAVSVNAASTEETNASMEELNATFTMISESANRLQTLASDLEDTVSYFKVE